MAYAQDGLPAETRDLSMDSCMRVDSSTRLCKALRCLVNEERHLTQLLKLQQYRKAPTIIIAPPVQQAKMGEIRFTDAVIPQ